MLKSVQYLRAIAAIMVVMHHTVRATTVFDPYIPSYALSAIKHNFSFGVDIFFVISGFVIYLSYIKKPKTAYNFVIDRIARIVPAYWAYSAIFAVILIFFPWSHPASSFDLVHFIKSLAFVPSQNPSPYGGIAPTLTVGWTLNFEMFFYACFFVAILIKREEIVLLTSFMMMISFFLPYSAGINTFYSSPRVFEFILGMLFASYYFKNNENVNIPLYVSVPLFIAAFLAAVSSKDDDFYVWIPAALTIVAIAVSTEKHMPKIKPLLAIGDGSYSLYLSHKIFICLGIIASRTYGYDALWSVTIAVVSCIVLSCFSYSILEVRCSKALKSATAR
ncbi:MULTISPECIES: acyltransferase family protein [Enterobacter cloacae complex]|uniref:acyltransferase family protein n=1 Tax=Enterobacter cloacae complex TaxID=354276 RepID=UPI0032AEB1F8